ncbi:MAG TPA: carbon-nitrogen hydrolase family protein [Syntrophales bacterium]|nr:carbon-nitrogen hydrolase family protein [Syntrophales bacterium]
MVPIRIAAVQMRAQVGVVARNLSSAEALVSEAFRRGAQWVILPEFFPSAIAFTPAMLSAWQPLEGPPLQLMRMLARKHDGLVGGSFIAKSGNDCFNSFLLVFPDGRYFRHDKDLPTMWENSYYIGGCDDGIFQTPAGPVGAAMCWELIRSQTARRLLGKVDFVVGGSCWWDLRLPVPPKYAEEQARLRELLRQAPAHLARMLGVPVVHASHAGDFEGLTPGNESIPYVSRYLGETQITDGNGQVLARMTYEDGEGVIIADITTGQVAGALEPIPDDFWTAELPLGATRAWEYLNELGRQYYAATVRPILEGNSSTA